MQQGETLSLQIETLNIKITEYLLELTWYHNGAVIVPNSERVMLSYDNKTLTITNFTQFDTGMYKVQFNQLFVHPPNEDCKEQLISLLRSHPVLKPIVFCVNTERDCSSDGNALELRRLSLHSKTSSLQGTFHSISLRANGTVQNSKELKHSSLQWYRNGFQLSRLSAPLQKHYVFLGLSQNFQQFNTSYEHSGRYEVLLTIDLNTYLDECQSYYDRFRSLFGIYQYQLAKGHIDIGYHKGKY